MNREMELQTDYTDDKVLQAMACVNISDFTYGEIKKIAKLIGVNILSGKNFAEPYLEKGIFNVVDSYLSFDAEHWLAIIKKVDPDTLAKNQKNLLYNCLHVESFFAQFIKCVNLSVRGFQCRKEFHDISFPYYLPFEDESDFCSLLKFLVKKPEMIDDLRCLNITILKPFFDVIIENMKYFQFDIPEESLYHIFVDTPYLSTVEKKKFKAELCFYYTFFREGNLNKALMNVPDGTSQKSYLEAIRLLQEENTSGALKIFKEQLRMEPEKMFGDEIVDFYYSITLVLNDTPESRKKIHSLMKLDLMKNDRYLPQRLLFCMSVGSLLKVDYRVISNSYMSPLQCAYALIFVRQYESEIAPSMNGEKQLISKIEGGNVLLLQLEMSNLWPQFISKKEKLQEITGMHPSLPKLRKSDPWERVLDKLVSLNSTKKQSSVENQERIAYFVNPMLSVQPKLQKSKDGINWSKGRNVSLSLFSKGTNLPMTEQDRKVATFVEFNWYGNSACLGGYQVIAALAGHPYVFDEFLNGSKLDIIEEKLQISVSSDAKYYRAVANVELDDVQSDYYIDVSKPLTIRVVQVNPVMVRNLKLLLSVPAYPKKSASKLTQVLELFSSDAVVMSDLLENSKNIKSRPSSSLIVVQLSPVDDQLCCSLWTKPFGDCPPYCKPGHGAEYVTTIDDGESIQTKRQLAKETENFDQILKLMADFEDVYENEKWWLASEQCLDLLDKLRSFQDICVVEWPEGVRYVVNKPALQSSSVRLSVNSISNWFEISGDIQINEKEKIKIADFIEKVSTAKGNFIQLKDDEYIRLEKNLRKQMDNLGGLLFKDHNKLKVSMFNAPQLKGLEDAGTSMKTDENYKKLMENIDASYRNTYKVPKNINAELRDYQKEGFVWMSRLASWGAGALLADDMGLGKTLQTITVLLNRANNGPALIVVPTSLILNWRDEIARFAPGLNVSLMNKFGKNREEMVKNAASFDVVITTYGLLITETDLLVGKQWNTIVLDEAHVIKNRDTKMSKAAMQLQTNFRILLTGTPVQNHLSEIWNLMQFANPGILDSYPHFNERFIQPIERDHNKDSQRMLRKILSPFILRRTKTDVLNELPEKTEITVKVDLSPEEWALYDNIRQKALANLEEHSSTTIQTLAEITKLRQAACNAKLIDKKLTIPSSKLESFMEMVENLHSNHHRALVFSQFTSHLALIRKALDKQKIEYLYLDGATTAKERTNLVQQFQQGDMPLFLISLKAGGLGLNLTAADYVIHLDPWWNPAVEEQASDRAYRIGQENPVTVYRLIAAGTIEEKIIQLHQTKKNLADALLEGGDVSAKMTREEILELLRQTSTN